MRLVRVGIVAVVALAASLVLSHLHPFGDAGLFAAVSVQAPIMEGAAVPPEVRALLSAKCADCHSTQTRTPVYGHFAPMSWLMERDIVEARKAMNLSRWDAYSADEQETLRAKIVHEVRSNEMPPLQYRMIHWHARMTSADVMMLARWARDSSSPGGAGAEATRAGDPVQGAAVFQKRCSGCHALTQNHEGPRLQGVYGRVAGSVPGFPYSDALRKAGIVWNVESLERWLTDPDAFVPGNNMDFHVAKPQERKDLVAFLKQSSGA